MARAPSEIRYARTPDGSQLGFAVVGSGAVTLLPFQPFVPIDLMWTEPSQRLMAEHLSAFSRTVWFDPRGRGASGSVIDLDDRLFECVADDMLTVLDTLDIERAVLLTFGGVPPALLFAAMHPERTQALVMLNPSARLRADVDYPGFSDGEVDAVLELIAREWGSGVLGRLRRQDESRQRWWGLAERLCRTPDGAVRAQRGALDADLRDILPTIAVPCLLFSSEGADPFGHARYIGDHIPDIRFVEVHAGDTGLNDPSLGSEYSESMIETIEEFTTGRLPEHDHDRALAAVLFTDIIGSTAVANKIGDRAWRLRLDAHDAIVRRALERFRGREVKAMGDGFVATFDGPARAIRCACAIRDELREIGLEIRAGVHMGEIELRGDDIGGVAVHIASRVSDRARPGEVLVSRTVTDLVAGSGIGFAARGEHELKGISGTWQLFAYDA
jgi:class 3 adenylate cyclase/pimeloyl-ACP methyl ester carboxylesterase